MVLHQHRRPRHLRFESLEHREVPAALTTGVDNDNYSPAQPTDWDGTDDLLSLREAIRMVNAGADTVIDFNGLTVTIGTAVDPTGDLPDITPAATVEGGRLDGNGLPGGLTLSNGGTVRNMTIVRVDGVALTVGGDGALVENNFIGTDANSTVGLGNGLGILIAGDNGVYRTNAVSGNADGGVVIDGSHNKLTANLIGLAPEGISPLRNGGPGVLIGVRDPEGPVSPRVGNVIGGYFPEERNFISGFATAGVLVSNGARDTKILGNRIGLHTEGGVVSGGNDGDGVLVEETAKRTIVGGPGDSQNWIVGVNAGVRVEGTTRTKVVGNVIGLQANDRAPTPVAEKNDVGVLVRNADRTIIGAVLLEDHSPENPQEGDGNVISGSTGPGILVEDSTRIRIVNNRIGTNTLGRAGTSAAPGTGNAGAGIQLVDSSRSMIGEPQEPLGNRIAGNEGPGVLIEGAGSFNNRIQSNRIGIVGEFLVNLTLGGRGNRGGGVVIAGGAHDNSVGVPGSLPNLIAGNSVAGVRITGTGTTDNKVLNNRIGTNPNGDEAIGNVVGIVLETGATGTRIGNADETGRNLISGNLGDGVQINGADGARVRNNWIGTDVNGTGPLGNGGHGVHIVTGSGAKLVGNTIAFNTGFGVRVDAGSGNRFDANPIFGNTGEGISLAAGANAGIGEPVIQTATPTPGNVQIAGLAATRPNARLRVQLFGSPAARADGQGEGALFLGEVTVRTDATGAFVANFALDVPAGFEVPTVTVTDRAGNTSEFSAPVTV